MAGEYESVELVEDETVRHLSLAVVIAALTAALAQVSIPVPGLSVPFSLQPFGSFLAGLVLGPLWGGFALAVYVAAGIAGAPVFSNGTAGLGTVAGSSGGFIVGFVFSAIVTGAIAHRQFEPRPLPSLDMRLQALALAAGLVTMYLFGLPWFVSVTGVSVSKSISVFLPFAAADAVKAAIVLGIVSSISILPER